MNCSKLLTVFLMSTLFWPGTAKPVLQGDRVRVICGEHKGMTGVVNYTWADGHVDVVKYFGFQHFYLNVTCLEKRNDN